MDHALRSVVTTKRGIPLSLHIVVSDKGLFGSWPGGPETDRSNDDNSQYGVTGADAPTVG